MNGSIKKHFRALQVRPKERAEAEARLTTRFRRPPDDGDVLWAVANDRLAKALKEGDWQAAKMIYFEMALQQFEEGKPYRTTLTESNRCELRQLANQGIRRVEVLGGCCPECDSLKGTELSVEAALTSGPIPFQGCSHRTSKSGPPGWCVCEYVAKWEDDL